jgi:hypothetical protein
MDEKGRAAVSECVRLREELRLSQRENSRLMMVCHCENCLLVLVLTRFFIAT